MAATKVLRIRQSNSNVARMLCASPSADRPTSVLGAQGMRSSAVVRHDNTINISQHLTQTITMTECFKKISGQVVHNFSHSLGAENPSISGSKVEPKFKACSKSDRVPPPKCNTDSDDWRTKGVNISLYWLKIGKLMHS